MTVVLIATLLFSGLSGLSSSVPRQFHVVKEQKSWAEAQQYCREKFIDLATIDDMAEMEKVKSMINEEGVKRVWIGLKHGSSPKWQWSLADRDFYKENEAEFRIWDKYEPNRADEDCVAMRSTEDGKWYDNKCSLHLPFICYDGRNSTQPYVLVEVQKNWADAQRYCREKHTDLASVRNQTENTQVKEVRGDRDVWIGLFSDAWEWSHGSSSSFRHWNTGEPSYGRMGEEMCAYMRAGSSGLWNDAGCHNAKSFICYEGVKRQIVRMELQTDSQVNVSDPVMLQAFLQQIKQRLREKGMPEDAKLTWITQPDGKIFKEEKKKEKIEEGKKRRTRTEL